MNKKWGQKISQYELTTCDLTINQLPHSETMRWLNLMKLWLERLIYVGWTVFVLVLCVLYLMRHQYKHDPFGFVWSILYIIVSCGVFILRLCDCLTTRHWGNMTICYRRTFHPSTYNFLLRVSDHQNVKCCLAQQLKFWSGAAGLQSRSNIR